MTTLELEKTELDYTKITMVTIDYRLFVEVRNPLNPMDVTAMLRLLADKIIRRGK